MIPLDSPGGPCLDPDHTHPAEPHLSLIRMECTRCGGRLSCVGHVACALVRSDEHPGMCVECSIKTYAALLAAQ